MSAFSFIARGARAALTVLLFDFFALGGLVITCLFLLFRGNRKFGHRMVRRAWKGLIWVCVHAGLISVECCNLENLRGRIIVANHPSLIDVVILTAFIPDVYSIAKSSLKRSPFFGEIIRKVMIANDEKVLEESRRIIAEGGNVLIFPEGTRTPLDGSRLKLHRGAAQLSIRLSAPVTPIRIEMSRRILAKGQSVLDMGEKTVKYRLSAAADIVPPEKSDIANRAGAVAMTAAIERSLFPSV